jgi:glycerol uptake facilitator
MLGAMLGTTLVWLIYKDHFSRSEDAGTKLACFCTGPAIRNNALNFLGETVGTFVLVFVVLYITGAELAEPKTPIGLGSVGAIPVAFLVWGIGLSLGGTTGYAINPARDLGPRIMHAILPVHTKGSSDWSYSWIPVLGPVTGATIAALVSLWIG